MESFRFRPRLTGLEARENPSVSPADVFAAMAQAKTGHDFLMGYLKDLNAPRDVYQVQYFKELMPTLARQNLQAANVLSEFSSSVLSNAAANPALAPFVLPVVTSIQADQQTAAITAGWMIKFGTDMGVPFPDGNPPPPPAPPAPESPPPAIDNGTVGQPGTTGGSTNTGTGGTTDNGTGGNTGGTGDNTGSNGGNNGNNGNGGTTNPPTDPTAGMSKTFPNLNDPNWRTTSSGLRILDEVTGSGTLVPAGATVTVHYIGWLTNGTQFDSSVDRGQPTQFSLNQVIAGWQEGVQGMAPGGVRYLYVPSNLAYGSAGRPPSIPGNADLVFEIKLISSP